MRVFNIESAKIGSEGKYKIEIDIPKSDIKSARGSCTCTNIKVVEEGGKTYISVRINWKNLNTKYVIITKFDKSTEIIQINASSQLP